jgi:glutathionyl-hydroquinone reductase
MNPPKTLLISFVRTFWHSLWLTMMQQLAPSDDQGKYQRSASQFRRTIEGNAESGRYHLYVGMSCPWAHRALIVRAIKGLQEFVPVTILVPNASTGGWVFQPVQHDCSTLAQFYRLNQPNYRAKATVPLLWDSWQKQIVNNESSEIIKLLNGHFPGDVDLYPASLEKEIEQWNAKIYPAINNGVYLCGFARTQAAYQDACQKLFQTLDEIELVLSRQHYLCGESLTLADIRLFTTLFRFDAVYYSLFKCSIKRIADYPNLSRYLSDIYNLPDVAATCNLEQVKKDYYGQLFPLNPSGIVPL